MFVILQYRICYTISYQFAQQCIALLLTYKLTLPQFQNSGPVTSEDDVNASVVSVKERALHLNRMESESEMQKIVEDQRVKGQQSVIKFYIIDSTFNIFVHALQCIYIYKDHLLVVNTQVTNHNDYFVRQILNFIPCISRFFWHSVIVWCEN